MEWTAVILCVVAFVVVLLVVIAGNAIRIVNEYQRLVLFRLGRCIGTRGPGLVFVIPVIDRVVRVDLREQVREVPHQTSITKDNAPLPIDFLWYYKVLDPAQDIRVLHHHAAGFAIDRAQQAVHVGAIEAWNGAIQLVAGEVCHGPGNRNVVRMNPAA